MKKFIKFDLLKDYYIRALDRSNWIVARMMDGTSKKGEPIQSEDVWGWYGDLSHAWRGAVDVIALESKHFPDLINTIERLEKLKKDLESK